MSLLQLVPCSSQSVRSIQFTRSTLCRKPGRLRLVGFALLMAALLLLQTLGLLHTLGHGLEHDIKHSESVAVAHATHADHAHEGAGFLNQLFSAHASDADCRLYDQLAGGHAVPSALAVTLPVAAPPFAVASFAGDALARWAALFNARGPPLTV